MLGTKRAAGPSVVWIVKLLGQVCYLLKLPNRLQEVQLIITQKFKGIQKNINNVLMHRYLTQHAVKSE